MDLLEAELEGEWAFHALFRLLLGFWFWLQRRNCFRHAHLEMCEH